MKRHEQARGDKKRHEETWREIKRNEEKQIITIRHEDIMTERCKVIKK